MRGDLGYLLEGIWDQLRDKLVGTPVSDFLDLCGSLNVIAPFAHKQWHY